MGAVLIFMGSGGKLPVSLLLVGTVASGLALPTAIWAALVAWKIREADAQIELFTHLRAQASKSL